MNYENFRETLRENQPPQDISNQLEALWHDEKGNWQKAHDLVDGPSDKLSARVHAYLHRKEGDTWNADYWYRRAGESRPDISLEEEWENLVERIVS